MNDLTIKSGGGDYRVEFIDTVEETLAKVRGVSHIAVLGDRCLWRVGLTPYSFFHVQWLEATEQVKHFGTVGMVLHWLQESKANKKARADAVELVLMDAPGEFKLVLTDWAALERGLTEYLSTENVYI